MTNILFCPVKPLKNIGDYQLLTPESTKGGVSVPKIRMLTDFNVVGREWSGGNWGSSGYQPVSRNIEVPKVEVLTLSQVQQELKGNMAWLNRAKRQNPCIPVFEAQIKAGYAVNQASKAVGNLLKATLKLVKF